MRGDFVGQRPTSRFSRLDQDLPNSKSKNFATIMVFQSIRRDSPRESTRHACAYKPIYEYNKGNKRQNMGGCLAGRSTTSGGTAMKLHARVEEGKNSWREKRRRFGGPKRGRGEGTELWRLIWEVRSEGSVRPLMLSFDFLSLEQRIITHIK